MNDCGSNTLGTTLPSSLQGLPNFDMKNCLSATDWHGHGPLAHSNQLPLKDDLAADSLGAISCGESQPRNDGSVQLKIVRLGVVDMHC